MGCIVWYVFSQDVALYIPTVDALNSNDLDQGMSATSEDLATIMTSVTAFNKIAARIQAIHKTQTALLLSKSGIPGKPYKVGSKVSFYKPPTAADVMKASRKAKHLTQFHGPATITESLSNNGTTFKLEYNGRT